ncbi:MAG: alcohol dehydrogenase catalytic domain-containing protein [Spirochaetota bacterium]|jgi:L-iditol 2-dehydrogenase|nr:alcohol dehydrogenase catalytic domain-containing protein [Spirochaetota bacterium]
MKALVYTGIKQLELKDVPEPSSDFIIKVLGCGICGTDLKTYQKGHHLFSPPAILGHEFYGLVEKAPIGCGYLAGDKVVVAPYAECGFCDVCMRGAGSLCANKHYVEGGAFCEKVGIASDYIEQGVFHIKELDDVYTLVEPLACVLNGFEQLDLKPTSRALVVGAGPMGALFALLFRAKGIPVAVVEPSAQRRERIASWGIEAFEPGGAGHVESPSAGQVEKGIYDIAIIAVNKKELVSEYIKFVADAGTVLMFSGLSSDEIVAIDAYSIHYRQVSLKGSFGYALHHFKEALSLIEAHKEMFSKIITHNFPLERGKEAFEMLASGEALKIVLRP